MPRPGGEAGKLGVRYEGIWTVGQILAVLSRQAASIVVEPLQEGEGIEFALRRLDGSEEYHSVKRQRAAGEWSLAALCQRSPAGRSILGDLFDKLRAHPSATCRFVSSTGANQLLELTERAQRRASSVELQEDLQSSDTLGEAYEKYVLPLAPNRETAFDWLQRTSVVLIDEATLTRHVDLRISELLYRPDGGEFVASNVRLQLADHILDCLGTRLDAEAIWAVERSLGYAWSDWASNQPLLASLAAANAQYTRNVELELINSRRVSRAEVAAMTAALTAPDGPRQLLLEAAAGGGKSCFLAQLLDALKAAGMPVFALRLDRHGSALNTADIGRQLLQIVRSPAAVLAGIAHGGACCLIVDQLDALSEASGRSPQLWELFDQLREEAGSYPNMRLVVACRSFDLDHDHRLRRLFRRQEGVQTVKLGLLVPEDVEAVVRGVGGDPAKLTAGEREILRTPLHLLLFTEAADQASPSFGAVGALFDQFWERKQRAVAARQGSESQWTAVVDKLCETLEARQSLTAPIISLDEWPQTRAAMLSEHVLIQEADEVRFFHESFFDYAFSRRFAALEPSLAGFLRRSEQLLSRRGQVRQVLSYLRDHDRSRYLRDLQEVLSDAGMRFHLKKMVFQWLGSLLDPGMDEWQILSGLIAGAESRGHALPIVRNSLPWFDLLLRAGVVREWLHSTDAERVDWGYWLLLFPAVREHRSAEAAGLLEPMLGVSIAWNERVVGYFRRGHAYESQQAQALYLKVLEGGLLEPEYLRGDGWWHTLYDAAENAPDFVIDAIGCWLDLSLRRAQQTGNQQVLNRHDFSQSSEFVVLTVAKGSPTAFAEKLLPRVARIAEFAQLREEEALHPDTVWGSRSFGSTTGIVDAILACLCDALRHVAAAEPELAGRLLAPYAETNLDTVAYLMLRALAANPSHFAEPILAFLLRHPTHLNIGYGSWSGGNGHAAVGREAISACVPHLSPESRLKLEQAILGYLTAWEAQTPGDHGWIERLLLEAFGELHLSPAGIARLKELRTRFPTADTDLPTGHREPPSVQGISREQAATFTDEQWLAAMKEYPLDWNHRGQDLSQGTAVELSRILGDLVRHDRARFAALVNRMEETLNAHYFSAILDGLCAPRNLSKEDQAADDAEFAKFSTEALLATMRRLHQLPGQPCGSSICEAFERLAGRNIAAGEFAMLAHYAFSGEGPPGEKEKGRQGPPPKAHSAHMQGYNSVRGRAARAIEAWLFADYSQSEHLLPILEKMITDESPAVRICVVEALLPLLNHDRALAVSLFLRAVEGIELAWGSDPFGNFLRYATRTHYTELRPLLELVLKSSSQEAVSTAAQQICVAALGNPQAEPDADAVRQGSEIMRVAAAGVYALNVGAAEVSAYCTEHLATCFADPADAVRNAAARCFSTLPDGQLARFEALIRAYVASPAFPTRHDLLLHKLEQSTWQLPDLVLRVAERFVEKCGKEAGDISTAAAGDAPTVGKLIVRLYRQTADSAIRSRCLDLIDEMERLQFYGVSAELDALQQ